MTMQRFHSVMKLKRIRGQFVSPKMGLMRFCG